MLITVPFGKPCTVCHTSQPYWLIALRGSSAPARTASVTQSAEQKTRDLYCAGHQIHTRSNEVIGDDKRLAVAARQQIVGVLVAHELFGLPVEPHFAPHAVRDVRQMAEGRRAVAFLDVTVEQFRVARPHGMYEVAEMSAVARTGQVHRV